VSLGASPLMIAFLYLHHNLQIVALLTLHFLINLPDQLMTELTISRMSSHQHYENICMSFLPYLRFW
jgi:hypothetical protein